MGSSFRGSRYFLSNMCPAPVIVRGRRGRVFRFPSAEAAFQAGKCVNERDACLFERVAPTHKGSVDAKRLGRSVRMRPDWNEFRLTWMRTVLIAKFTQNPELARKLLATGDEPLVENNTWGDRFWGVCEGRGENHLGQILMEVRTQLRERDSVAKTRR